MKGVFITGTDTNVGKTFFSALMLTRLRETNIPARYYKPVQTGPDSDSDSNTITKLSQAECIRPAYEFPEPLSPNRAGALCGVEISLKRIANQFVPGPFTVVEGAGGLLVPLNENESMRDLCLYLDLPLIIMARTQLGTINHTLLTVEAARSQRCRIIGLVLNGEEDPGLAEILSKLSGLPVLTQLRPWNSAEQSFEVFARHSLSTKALEKICQTS